MEAHGKINKRSKMRRRLSQGKDDEEREAGRFVFAPFLISFLPPPTPTLSFIL